MENNNWRNEDARQKIVSKIMDTLHRHMPQTGVDGMQELKKIAIRFEEKIFSNSQNQQDYLRKISMKMLSLETKANNNNNQFPAGANQRPIEHNPMLMQQQMRNQAQNLSNGMPLPAQSQVQQLQQNLQSNISANGMTNSAGVGSSLNNVSNLTQQQNPNIGGQGPGLQTMSGMNQNSMNTNPTQVYNQNLLAQRQMQARQQQLPQQTLQQQNPQSQAQQQMFFKQQQASLLQQKNQQQYQQLQSSMLQQQQQQQQQSLSQNTLQQTQQPLFQQTQQSTLQSTQSAMLQQSQPSMMQQSQQNIYQQTQQSNSQAASQPVLQHQQQVMRQQQHPVMQQQQQQQQQQSMAQQPMLPTQQQHPQLMGSQTSFQQHQHTLQHLLQSKNQQSHQGSASLLQQQQQQQNQLLPQLQPQAQNMQTQQQQQQQQQMMQQPMQNDLQQRLQASGGLLPQQQNTLDQQKQLLQQRGLSEASSTSVESSSQAGQPVIAEWQEKVYQRLQAMKDLYFVELKDLFQKLNYRCQKPMPPDQSEKFKHYKAQLQRVLNYFNAPKNAIPVNFKEEHVEALEKRVQNILNSFRPKPSAQQQPGQQQIQNQMGQGQPMQQQIQNQMGQGQPMQQQSQPQMGHMQSMQQQSQSQMGQVPQEQKHVTPFQQMNLQPSVSSMQPNTVAPLQNSTMPLIQQSSGQASQQTMQTSMQSQAALNTQGANVNSLQQSSANQIPHNPLQHNNISSLQQRGINSMQSSVQQGSNNPHGHIQQAQQLKHLQQQRILQMQQQQKQAAQLQHQLQAPQVSQLQQLNDNDAKLKQGPMKSTFMQPHQMNQRAVLQQQQQQQQHLKQASSLSASSPQILPAGSPQVSQQSSPQVDQQSLLASPLQTSKVGTPLQPATSPFLNPSPSNLPVPSPLIDDSERQLSVTTSVSNVAGTQGFQQSVSAMSHAQSLAIGTPGISASPLLADFSPSPAQNNLNQDGTQIVSSGIMAAEKSNITEPPLERIMKVMGSMSSKSMASVVNDIGSVVSLMDRMAGSAPGNGSRTAVGEDLVAMTKCRLQARNLMSQDGSAATKKMRRCISSMPLSTVSSAGTVSNSFQQHSSVESPEMDSTATSKVKKSRLEMIHALEEEIQEINNQLIDTVVEVSEDDNDAAAAAAASEGRDGTLVKCSYMAMALSPCMKSHYHSSQVIPISPLRLLIPESYPNSSPVLVDRTPVQACSKEYADLSSRAKEYFNLAVRTLPQPMSLKALVKIWDECARSTVAEYAHRSGGGSFSSRFGRWESCASA